MLAALFDTVGGVLNIVWSILCIFVYGLIRTTFNLFIRISELDLLSSTDLSGIYQRVTMILTIIMVFYITFAFVKYTVSPDTITDKEKGAGGIIKRIIIAIILIAFVPTIFSTAYDLQNKLIKTQVFSKIILGQGEWDYTKAGNTFAADTFSAFYRVDYDKCGSNCKKSEEIVDDVIKSMSQGGGTFGSLIKANIGQIDNGVEFDGLLALIFGVFVIYILFLYCMDVGVRYAQLLFLQIIAPIAIISSIAPAKDSMLKKWGKACLTTYLDLFIRISLIYFMLLIIGILGDSLAIGEMTRNGDKVGIFVYIFMVLGLLIFAQKAPKMIKELFPSSGGAASIGFGFGTKERFEPIGKSLAVVKKPIAATTGAIAGTARAIAGLKTVTKGLDGFRLGKRQQPFGRRLQKGLTGAYSIAKAGAKGATAGAKSGKFKDAMAAGRQSVQKDEAHVNKGGTILGSALRGGHYQDMKVQLEAEIDEYKLAEKTKKAMKAAIGETKIMKEADGMIQAARSPEERNALERRKKAIEKAIQQGNTTYSYRDERGNDVTGNVTIEQGDKTYVDRLNQNVSNFAKQIQGSEKLKMLNIEYEENGIIRNKALGNFTHTELRKYMSDIEAQVGTKLEAMEMDEKVQKIRANASEDKK